MPELIERTQYWGRQMLIWGVHVHVGIDRRDKVLPILDALLNYYPYLLALSASSPMWAAGHQLRQQSGDDVPAVATAGCCSSSRGGAREVPFRSKDNWDHPTPTRSAGTSGRRRIWAPSAGDVI